MITYKLPESSGNEEKRCISIDISSAGIKIFSKEALTLETNIQLSKGING